MEKIGATIRNRRVQLGINQQTLALLSETGINTIVAIERGTGNPTVSTLARILNVLGLQLDIRIKGTL